MHDVIVCDEEYQSASTAIRTALMQLDMVFMEYTRALKQISNSVLAGNRGDALRSYADKAEEVRGIIADIADQHTKACSCFLQDVDETDAGMY